MNKINIKKKTFCMNANRILSFYYSYIVILELDNLFETSFQTQFLLQNRLCIFDVF